MLQATYFVFFFLGLVCEWSETDILDFGLELLAEGSASH